MKILHTVEFYHPSVGGMQEVVKQLSERLACLGHDITVATTKLVERKEPVRNGVKIIEFGISGNLVKGMTGETEHYQNFLMNTQFDIVTNFAAQQWATDLALPILDQIKAKKVFVPTGFSGLHQPEYKQYFERMKQWLHKYNMNVFLSNNYRDINFARAAGVEKITVIPNGAAADEFLSDSGINIRQVLGIQEAQFLILHVGSHTGVKGHREAIRIFEKSNIENATFLIVANSFGGGCTRSCQLSNLFFKLNYYHYRKNKKLIVTELSRAETVAAYKQADLFLFPSNIECSPLVLFECMASKTPFLSTDVGNAKEIADWSGGGVILPTITDGLGICKANIEKSVDILEEIYRDNDKRQAMAEKAYESWLEMFTWEKITKQYESLYFSVWNEKNAC